MVILPRWDQQQVAWLATRLGGSEEWGQCYSSHHIFHGGHAYGLSVSMSAHGSCSLGFAASWPAWQGENLSLQGGVASDAQGAPWWRGPPKWCFPFPSAWDLQGQELWMNRAGEDKGCGEIMAALCQVDLNCWTKPSCSRRVSRASQGEEPEWLNIFPRPKQDKGVIWNRILHDPCTPPRLLHGAYVQITVGFCSSSCLRC